MSYLSDDAAHPAVQPKVLHGLLLVQQTLGGHRLAAVPIALLPIWNRFLPHAFLLQLGGNMTGDASLVDTQCWQKRAIMRNVPNNLLELKAAVTRCRGLYSNVTDKIFKLP